MVFEEIYRELSVAKLPTKVTISLYIHIKKYSRLQLEVRGSIILDTLLIFINNDYSLFPLFKFGKHRLFLIFH